jgi:RHS repeat-associated protein
VIASTFFDPVLGIDMHFEMVPMPAPVPVPFPHPFVGMVFDPGGLISGLLISNAIGMIAGAPPTGPVLVNFMPATNTGTDVKNKMVLPHFVIPPGTMWTPMPKAPKPKIGKHAAPAPDLPVAPAGDAVLMMGSKTVAIMGSNAVRLGDLAMSCSEPVRLPSSVVLAIPKGPPVLMGGPPAIDWQQAMGALLRSKWVSNHLHGLVSRIKNQRWRNFLHKAVCFLTGHPVDVATGRLLTWSTDFELPGPLPLKFERNYASSWSDRDSVLGFGWSHSLDQAVWMERGKVVYRAEDGREIEFDTFGFPDHVMQKGDSCYDPFNRLTLRCLGQFCWEIETADGLVHEFAPVSGDSRKGYARLITQRTREGHAIQLAYDAQGCLEWVTDSAGRRILFAHDERGRLTRIALPHPRDQKWVMHARYVYSAEGDLVEVHDALGNVARWAYEGHLLVKETDRTGLSFYFGYDGAGSDASCIRTWGDGGIYDHEIVYDKQSHVTAVTNSLGHTTTYFANAMNAVVKVLDPLGGETKYEYDDYLRKTAETDALGNTRTTTYDEKGNVVAVKGPDGAVVRIEYDARNLPVKAIDALGGIWSWAYDMEGHPIEKLTPTGERMAFGWKDGLLVWTDAPGARRTLLEYDKQKNLILIRVPNGATTRYEYDGRGRPVCAKDARGALSRFNYDLLGNLLRVESPTGLIEELAYDSQGNLLELRNATRHVRFRYGHYHKILAREEAGTTRRFIYDTEGRLTGLINEVGETYAFTLDACGNVREEVGFDGRTRSYLRDRLGRVTQSRLPSGRTSEFTYDSAGRVRTVKHSDGTSAEFAYRADGALVCAKNESTTVLFERDALGRAVRELQGDHFVSSCFDTSGERVVMETSLGGRMAIVRDALGEVVSLHCGNAPLGSSQLALRFERDKLGLETARLLPGGVRVEWQRDRAGRPISRRTVLQNAGTPLEQLDARTYEWRGEDQIAAMGDTQRGTTHYHHDARGRLVAQVTPQGTLHRSMDTAGNVFRTAERKNRRYGRGGRIEDAEGARYVYDEDGNRTERAGPDGDGWRYRWNGAGMLSEAECSDGRCVRFEYDAFARRTRRTLIRKLSDESEVVEADTRFVWDGGTLLHEVPADAGVTTWYFEPGTSIPVAKEQDGHRWSIASDHLGTPTEMYDEMGRVAWRMQLDVFGVGKADVALQQCPWRWQGQYEDEETGLYYNRFRYYDAQTGRYISPDPVGLLGGLNRYEYCHDPLIYVDPLGLTPTWGVDPTMFPGDTAAGVLRDGSYQTNPTRMAFADLEVTPGGKLKHGGQLLNGQYMYVVDQNGQILLGTRSGSRMPHPTLVGGVDPRVQAAGIMDIRGGKIHGIDTASGHFKPSAASLDAVERALSDVDRKVFAKNFAYKDHEGKVCK